MSVHVRSVGLRDLHRSYHGHTLAACTDPMTGAKRSATFLPEVAAHENWNRQQTIDALIRKSGYSGSVTPEMRARLRVTRYRSTTATLTYAQYLLRVDGPQPSAKQADVSVPACIAVPA